MEIKLYKQTPAQNENGEPVMLWKFVDENGNLWNTETPADGTEQQAAEIILQSIVNN